MLPGILDMSLSRMIGRLWLCTILVWITLATRLVPGGMFDGFWGAKCVR